MSRDPRKNEHSRHQEAAARRLGLYIPSEFTAAEATKFLSGAYGDVGSIESSRKLGRRRLDLKALADKGFGEGWSYPGYCEPSIGYREPVRVVVRLDVGLGKLLYRMPESAHQDQIYHDEHPENIEFEKAVPPPPDFVPSDATPKEKRITRADFTGMRNQKFCQHCSESFGRSDYTGLAWVRWMKLFFCKKCMSAANTAPFPKLRKQFCFRCKNPYEGDQEAKNAICSGCTEERIKLFRK